MGGGEGIDPFLSPKRPGVALPKRGGSPRNHVGPLPSSATSPTRLCPYFVSWGLWKEGAVHSASAGTRGEHDRRVTVLVVVLTLLIVLGWSESTAAQPIERPTDCTESISIGTIFIGHDCGEWASVLISGNAIIREPWSRASRASRAVRLRERREGYPPWRRRRPFPTVTRIPIPWTVLYPQMRGTATGAGRRLTASTSSFAARQCPSRRSLRITVGRRSS